MTNLYTFLLELIYTVMSSDRTSLGDEFEQTHYFIIIIIIIMKKSWQCKAARERLKPYQSEDPSPTIRS